MKKEAHWKKKLTPDQYHVLREKGTEAPFTSDLLKNKGNGMYACAACGTVLFASDAKFDSGTGWPSFDEPANKEHIVLQNDISHGIRRVEVLCKTCGGHLGHLFPDGPTTTGQRFCINGCALTFREKPETPNPTGSPKNRRNRENKRFDYGMKP